MSKRKIIKNLLWVIIGAVFLIAGIPIIINECYKANCGYLTVWDGADMLGYYGTVLGSIIAVATLAITIVFTKKQIQRDSFLKNENEKWDRLKAIFMQTLSDINPLRVLKDVMDNGITDPTKAINLLQRYQLDCKIANDTPTSEEVPSTTSETPATVVSVAPTTPAAPVVTTTATTPTPTSTENVPVAVANTKQTPVTAEQAPVVEVEEFVDAFDREAVMKFINDYGLLTYDVRSVRISNYLASLYKMARLLTQTELCKTASKEVIADIVRMIHDHTEGLKATGKYDELADMVQQFKLSTQIFDVFGETVDNYSIHDLFTTTDTDIDRQFRLAETKLGSEGVANEYGRQYFDGDEPNAYKIDVIIFAADDECIKSLHTYAEAKFHNLNDTYRRYIAKIDSDRFRRQYDSIVSDGDIVSKHNFRLPETIQVAHEDGGKEYSNHLFVNANTGTAVMKLNGWEEGVIAEEEKNPDFVCWLRNPSRKSWSLCIPYEMDNETKPAYPDFIVIRKDAISGYVIDILEPHNPEYIDNLGKAKGFAEYARQNPGVGRIQLIRMAKDISGKNRFKRLDMSMSAVRDKVSRVINNDELDHIFDTDGFFITVFALIFLRLMSEEYRSAFFYSERLGSGGQSGSY